MQHPPFPPMGPVHARHDGQHYLKVIRFCIVGLNIKPLQEVTVKCFPSPRNPCGKIVASHVPYELPWKSGFSPPCPKSSSLLSLFPRPPPSHHLLSLSFMDMDGRRRDQRGGGPGNGVGQCHPQSIIDANNYHIRRAAGFQWTDLALPLQDVFKSRESLSIILHCPWF